MCLYSQYLFMLTQIGNSDTQFGNYCISSEDNTLLRQHCHPECPGIFSGLFSIPVPFHSNSKTKQTMYFRKQGGKSGRQTSPFILSALNYGVLQGTCRPVMDCLSSSPFCHHCLSSDNSWMTTFPQDFFIQDFRRKCKTVYQDFKTYSSAPVFPLSIC